MDPKALNMKGAAEAAWAVEIATRPSVMNAAILYGEPVIKLVWLMGFSKGFMDGSNFAIECAKAVVKGEM